MPVRVLNDRFGILALTCFAIFSTFALFGVLGLVVGLLVLWNRYKILVFWGRQSRLVRAVFKISLDLIVLAALLATAGYDKGILFFYSAVYLAVMLSLNGYSRGIDAIDWKLIAALATASLFAAASLLIVTPARFALWSNHSQLISLLLFTPATLILIRIMVAELARTSLFRESLKDSEQTSSILVLPEFNELLARVYSDLARANGYELIEIWVLGPARFSFVGSVKVRKNLIEPLPLSGKLPTLLLPEAGSSIREEKVIKEFSERSKEMGYPLKRVNSPADGFRTKSLGSFELNELWSEIFESRSSLNFKAKDSFFLPSAPVLVTGGAGSIGSTLVGILNDLGFSQIHVLDNSEIGLYEFSERFGIGIQKGLIEYHYVDIKDKQDLKDLLYRIKPQIIFHAAASKHVHIVEQNLDLAYRTNVEGTANILSSLPPETQQFTLISTDKAVYPENFMGATKRMAENLVAFFQSSQSKSNRRYSIVRFGNVFGSSGSAPLKFIEQITRGNTITLTDERMERFFMSIREACYLVVQTAINRKEVMVSVGQTSTYVLDMGEPVKIMDLIHALVKLAGKRIVENAAGSDELEIRVIGQKEGEKLFEELSHDAELMETEIDGVKKAKTVYFGDVDFSSEFKGVLKNKKLVLEEFLSRYSDLITSESQR
jgi:FlaA1/EpsC-like NDP-sugar epimerase